MTEKNEKVTALPFTPDAEGAKALADAITKIEAAMRALLTAGLKYEAIVTLVAAHSKVGKDNVRYVLNTLADLRTIYCAPKKKPDAR